jgi:hypothetical protein
LNDDERTEAIKLGLQRAGFHWLRAGYEIVAGVGAFLDEVVRVRRDGEDPEAGELDEDLVDPTRIDLE